MKKRHVFGAPDINHWKIPKNIAWLQHFAALLWTQLSDKAMPSPGNFGKDFLSLDQMMSKAKCDVVSPSRTLSVESVQHAKEESGEDIRYVQKRCSSCCALSKCMSLLFGRVQHFYGTLELFCEKWKKNIIVNCQRLSKFHQFWPIYYTIFSDRSIITLFY